MGRDVQRRSLDCQLGHEQRPAVPLCRFARRKDSLYGAGLCPRRDGDHVDGDGGHVGHTWEFWDADPELRNFIHGLIMEV